jgi:hypothetical protein
VCREESLDCSRCEYENMFECGSFEKCMAVRAKSVEDSRGIALRGN